MSGIVKTPGVVGGCARIDNTRIAVWVLVACWREGLNDAEVLRLYPTLSPEDVAAARSYAEAHPGEIDRDLQDIAGEYEEPIEPCPRS